jgi:GTP-binding protein
MKIKNAEFIKSSTTTDQCPDTKLPEYAFIGRSNVGKSSLINALTGHKKLALISNKPGKTQTINHFLINKSWYLADLPGYGYAKVSKKQRSVFSEFIQHYLLNRTNLTGTFVLIDSRHEPLKNDLDFLEWLGKKQIPFAIVFTKMDKLSSSTMHKNILEYKKKLTETWEPLPLTFNTSAVTKAGVENILKFIAEANENLVQ